MKPIKVALFAFTMLIVECTFSQALTPPTITLQTFNTTLSVPVGIYNSGDHRLFVLEQNQADIEILDTNGTYIGTFLDLTGLVSTGGERGLLGLAFHPDYLNNGYFFVNYTNTIGSTVIARYQVSANPQVANPASASILLTITQPFTNHNGGHIAFGPDGYLYIGMGDGGSAGDPGGRSQNPLVLLGKMLRIDIDNGLPYTIPASNPYFEQTDTLPEIWALGMRNPWKFSFDRLTGDMWIGDVGQGTQEEIDFEAAGSPGGKNWGWKCYEGNVSYSTAGCQPMSFYDFPVQVHTHAEGYCSITGGVVYRGHSFPALNGLYFFTDYCTGLIMSLYPNGSGGYIETNMFSTGAGVVAFGESSAGEVYVAKNTNTIYKLADSCPFYPDITSNGAGVLQSAAGTNYWWYRNDLIIPGATQATYTPTLAGTYYARVSNGTCTRQTNSISWIIVEGIGGCTYANATNYDSTAEVDDGSCLFSVNCDCPADLNVDGIITVEDLILFMGVFGTSCN